MSNYNVTPLHFLVDTINQRHVAAYEAMPDVSQTIRTKFLEPIKRWYERKATIMELEYLSDRLLADIGITRGEILHAVDGNIYRRSARDELLFRG